MVKRQILEQVKIRWIVSEIKVIWGYTSKHRLASFKSLGEAEEFLAKYQEN